MQGEAVLHSGCGSRSAAWFTGAAALVMFGAMGGLLIASGHRVVIAMGAVLWLLAVVSIPWQLLDAVRRKHVLTERGLRYRCGVLGRFEVDVPYGSVQGVMVRQGIVHRILGCADVRIAAPGVSGPVLVSSRDYNSVVLRSIPDFEAVARGIREGAARAWNPPQA